MKSEMQKLHEKLTAKGIAAKLIPNFRQKKTDRHWNVNRKL
ncbi:hypothetical protein GGGNBK_21625 [Sporosarcina sp. ANT_H38]|nr:hypothetical protein [Sporosarcina sp. ANT_H38]